jgi:exodeoxyribonuclease VII small subunit
MTPADQLPYNQALTELEQILNTLRSDKCDVDSLVSLTKRAAELLTACRNKLTTTDQQLRELLQSLQPEG